MYDGVKNTYPSIFDQAKQSLMYTCEHVCLLNGTKQFRNCTSPTPCPTLI